VCSESLDAEEKYEETDGNRGNGIQDGWFGDGDSTDGAGR
jgi:hypothetical protein